MSKLINDITIAIKTFERPECLKDLLASIRQFYPNVHIIVADDSRKPYAKEVTSRFSNVEYVLLPFDVGLSAGRNAILERIKTKYFVLCDDDFLFCEESKLEDFKKILDETDIELIGGCVMNKTKTGEFNSPNTYAGNISIDSSRHYYMVTVKPQKPFVRCDIVVNWFMADTQAVIQKTGGWDQELKINEHSEFFWRAKLSGLKVASTSDVRVNHADSKNVKHHVSRTARGNKYDRILFKKLGIKAFTNIFGTVYLYEIQPWIIRFVFGQKCVPWFVIQKWRKFHNNGNINIKAMRTWLFSFIFKQKCVPWRFSRGYRKYISYIFVPKKINRFNRRGIILRYHRVIELDQDPWELSVTPSHFDEHMQVIKRIGRPIQTQEMGKNLKRYFFGKKDIVVSFDDGYGDNFIYAKPILERHGVPATFYIISGAIGRREEFWWDALDRIILTPKTLPAEFQLTIAGKEYNYLIVTHAQNERPEDNNAITDIPSNGSKLTVLQLYFVLYRILSLLSTLEERKLVLHEVTQWADSKELFKPRPTHLPMDIHELKTLARSSLFELGAHTACHPMLSKLTIEDQEREIDRSKSDLEHIIGCSVNSFSYPFGNQSNETVKIVKRLGFQNACITDPGPIERTTNPFLLPRFGVMDWDGDQFEENLRKWLV